MAEWHDLFDDGLFLHRILAPSPSIIGIPQNSQVPFDRQVTSDVGSTLGVSVEADCSFVHFIIVTMFICKLDNVVDKFVSKNLFNQLMW